jgi:drug/metabolite transporter (DMT)-like permease
MKAVFIHFHPLAFALLRFVIATISLALAMRLFGHPLRIEREDLTSIIGLGILSNTVYQIIFVLGLDYTKAGNAGLLMSATPIFAYLAGLILRRERFSFRVLFGILLSMIGVCAIVFAGAQEVVFGATWYGDLMILAAALCWGWYSGSSPRLIAKYGPMRLTFWLMLTGTLVLVPPLLPFAYRQEWRAIPLSGWLGFGYSTFGAIVFCYLAWSYALKHAGVPRTAIYANVTPMSALVAAWFLLGEPIAALQLIGAVLILTGVFLVRSRQTAVPALERKTQPS